VHRVAPRAPAPAAVAATGDGSVAWSIEGTVQWQIYVSDGTDDGSGGGAIDHGDDTGQGDLCIYLIDADPPNEITILVTLIYTKQLIAGDFTSIGTGV